MRLPRLDVIFGLAAPVIDILERDTGIEELQVRDDKARVRPFRADFAARDNPLDAAPVRGLPTSLGMDQRVYHHRITLEISAQRFLRSEADQRTMSDKVVNNLV